LICSYRSIFHSQLTLHFYGAGVYLLQAQTDSLNATLAANMHSYMEAYVLDGINTTLVNSSNACQCNCKQIC